MIFAYLQYQNENFSIMIGKQTIKKIYQIIYIDFKNLLIIYYIFDIERNHNEIYFCLNA